jgi:hypothetical protein
MTRSHDLVKKRPTVPTAEAFIVGSYAWKSQRLLPKFCPEVYLAPPVSFYAGCFNSSGCLVSFRAEHASSRKLAVIIPTGTTCRYGLPLWASYATGRVEPEYILKL